MPSVRMRITSVLAAVATAAVVGACGGPSGGEQQAGQVADAAVHDAADVAFAQNMIPHHQQAVDMSAMVPSHTTNHDLIIMAKHISLDQQAEIDTLHQLLGQWGQPGPPEGHHDMGPDVMVDTATMNKLPTLTGPEFDTLWLRSMISHHQGAVAMALPEIANGKNPNAVKMAKKIVQWQQFEIGQMHALLGPSE
jgi:uncharacterized protein (DUF305 family)